MFKYLEEMVHNALEVHVLELLLTFFQLKIGVAIHTDLGILSSNEGTTKLPLELLIKATRLF